VNRTHPKGLPIPYKIFHPISQNTHHLSLSSDPTVYLCTAFIHFCQTEHSLGPLFSGLSSTPALLFLRAGLVLHQLISSIYSTSLWRKLRAGWDLGAKNPRNAGYSVVLQPTSNIPLTSATLPGGRKESSSPPRLRGSAQGSTRTEGKPETDLCSEAQSQDDC
jgi:hypothetical protein